MEIWNGEKVLTEEDLIAPAFLQAWNDFLDCKYAVQIFSGGRGCVAAGTRLDTPYGKVRVEDFQGGLVYSYDGEKIIRAYAHKPIRYTEENLYRVKLSNGDSILVTDQHKFLTVAHGWRTTKQLARGDEIVLASRDALDGASFPAVFRSYDEVIEEERNPNLARSDAFTYSRHDTLTTATVKDVYFECRDYYYDLFVPFYHNYVAEGIVNHNSTKSTFITLAILIGLDMYPNAHAVVYRKVASTLQGSVFNAFQKTINELLPGTEIAKKWKFIKSPLMMRNVETGQTIIFKGLDDPLKSKSISPPFGYYRFLFMEELAEYDGMAEVRSVRQSVLRGKGPFQSFYAYNPPETASEWVNYDLKKQLAVDPTLHLYHSTYRTVPIKWLGEDFFREAYFVSKVNERAYRHEYLGEITGTGGTIFPNVTLRKITDEEIDGFASLRWGADFGATDPNVLLGLNYESSLKRILIFTESYGSMMLLDEIEADWRSKYFGHEYIYADSACKQMIMELQNRGFNMMGAVKGADSILHGISWLRNLWEIVIDPERCPNAAREFTHYEFLRLPDNSFSNKFPELNNHTIDACLRGDTLVWTNDGKKPIESLVGTSGLLYSYDSESCQVCVSKYINVRKTRTYAETVCLHFTDRMGTVVCTPDHRILTSHGYVSAMALTKEDIVLTNCGVCRMEVRELLDERYDVYDLEVPQHHNFFVGNGVCVHNCRYAVEDLSSGAGII